MKFDAEFCRRLKVGNRGYEGSKPSPQYWVDMLEEYPKFDEDFKRVFNNADITEADVFTPEALEDTYVDLEVSLPIYG